MTANFVARVLRENEPLFARIARFNLHVASQLDPEQLHRRLSGSGTGADHTVPATLFERLASSRRGEQALSDWIAAGRPSHAEIWDFSNPRWRLALVEANRLRELLRQLGAAVLHREVARAVTRDDVQRWKRQLGEAAYRFALQRVPFLAMSIPDPLASVGGDPGDAGRSADRIGVHALSICLADAPTALRERVNLQLPPANSLVEVATADEQRDLVWRFVKRVLLAESSPELAACFN